MHRPGQRPLVADHVDMLCKVWRAGKSRQQGGRLNSRVALASSCNLGYQFKNGRSRVVHLSWGDRASEQQAALLSPLPVQRPQSALAVCLEQMVLQFTTTQMRTLRCRQHLLKRLRGVPNGRCVPWDATDLLLWAVDMGGRGRDCQPLSGNGCVVCRCARVDERCWQS
jgi:hypothetical protein